MNKDEFFKSLSKLTALSGVSGRESEVVKVLLSELEEYADEISVDYFGNIIAHKKGARPGKAVLIVAHSDEVGGVVTSITEKGFIRFVPVGVIDVSVLKGQRVIVAGQRGTVISPPGHAEKKAHSPDSSAHPLFIDIGKDSSKDVIASGVDIGDVIAFDSPLERLKDSDLVMGKAIDDRVGCLVLIELFKHFHANDFPGELIGAISVQEEIGMRGARMIAQKVKPDFAIMLDTVPLDDSPEESMPDVPIKIGTGPVVQLWTGKNDIFLGTVAHEAVSKLLFSSAKAINAPIQKVAAYGKWVTDGAEIHLGNGGTPTGFLSIPRRYGHTPNEVADINDAITAVQVLIELVQNQTQKFDPNFV